MKKEKVFIASTGIIVGLLAVLLVKFPSSVEVLGNFRRLHFFLALMSHTT